jgi:hypothetical protein
LARSRISFTFHVSRRFVNAADLGGRNTWRAEGLPLAIAIQALIIISTNAHRNESGEDIVQTQAARD